MRQRDKDLVTIALVVIIGGLAWFALRNWVTMPFEQQVVEGGE